MNSSMIYFFIASSLGFVIILGFLWKYFYNNSEKYTEDPKSQFNFEDLKDFEYQIVEVEISGEAYRLELADTPRLRERGLMNREFLPENGGMLFVFPNSGIYPFWMKNTLIPLDIIWLDQNKKIVFIKENASPCSNLVEEICSTIIPKSLARYVIELDSGKVSGLNLKLGDQISFDF